MGPDIVLLVFSLCQLLVMRLEVKISIVSFAWLFPISSVLYLYVNDELRRMRIENE